MKETSLRKLAQLFLKLGTVAFGGPAAHIVDDAGRGRGPPSVVQPQHFLDLVGGDQHDPRPHSTELAIHIGYERGSDLFGLGLLVMAVHGSARFGFGATHMLFPLPIVVLAQDAGSPVTLDRLLLVFLKIGAVLYGGGYVILAFLQNDFVDRLGLTQQQLIDAVSVGQVTPGPVFTTATFIGYVLKGVPGALVAARINSAWLILAGGAIGLLVDMLR